MNPALVKRFDINVDSKFSIVRLFRFLVTGEIICRWLENFSKSGINNIIQVWTLFIEYHPVLRKMKENIECVECDLNYMIFIRKIFMVHPTDFIFP